MFLVMMMKPVMGSAFTSSSFFDFPVCHLSLASLRKSKRTAEKQQTIKSSHSYVSTRFEVTVTSRESTLT